MLTCLFLVQFLAGSFIIVYLPSPNNDSPSFFRRNSSQLDSGIVGREIPRSFNNLEELKSSYNSPNSAEHKSYTEQKILLNIYTIVFWNIFALDLSHWNSFIKWYNLLFSWSNGMSMAPTVMAKHNIANTSISLRT